MTNRNSAAIIDGGSSYSTGPRHCLGLARTSGGSLYVWEETYSEEAQLDFQIFRDAARAHRPASGTETPGVARTWVSRLAAARSSNEQRTS